MRICGDDKLGVEIKIHFNYFCNYVKNTKNADK